MQKTAKKGWTTRLKNIPVPARWAVGYVGVLGGSAVLAYFWRVVFEQGDRLGMLPLTGSIALVMSAVYLALFLVCHFGKRNLCLKAALLVFVLGVLFSFANPPLQAPDEQAHFLRAYSISNGHFDYDYNRGYSADVALLAEKFEPYYNFRVVNQQQPLVSTAFAEYNEQLATGEYPPPLAHEPIMMLLLPFLPQALGIAAARLLGFGVLGMFYAARLVNLLLYTLLCYKVFKNCDKFRGVFFALALLPLSLFMAASCSYDSIMLALCYFIISFFCKKEIRNTDLLAFGAAVLFATYLKPMNIVLAAVLLLIPKARWKSNAKPWVAFGVMVVAALLFKFGLADWLNGNVLAHNYPANLPRGNDGTADPTGQLAFMARNPLAFLMRLLLTLLENAGFLFNLGSFGSLDLFIPLVSGLSVLSLGTASALGIQQKDDTKPGGALGLLLAALLYAGTVMVGIYVADSGFESIRITGLQPRYFLPVFLLLFMLASILLGKAVRPQLSGNAAVRTEHLTLWIVAAIAFFAVVLLFQYNFIGQWMPKGDSGYKMVNLFGWEVY